MSVFVLAVVEQESGAHEEIGLREVPDLPAVSEIVSFPLGEETKVFKVLAVEPQSDESTVGFCVVVRQATNDEILEHEAMVADEDL
jgi:hypothetical protein